MSFRNLVLGLWIVNYVDPLATGEPIDGGSVLVVPNHGDVYAISGLPDEAEWMGAETRGEAAGLPSDWSEVLSDEPYERGEDARRKKKLIKNPHHRVIESAHPSPLSAYRGFFGSKPFSTTNALLNEVDLPPIDWSNTNIGEVDQADR